MLGVQTVLIFAITFLLARVTTNGMYPHSKASTSSLKVFHVDFNNFDPTPSWTICPYVYGIGVFIANLNVYLLEPFKVGFLDLGYGKMFKPYIELGYYVVAL